MNWKIDEFEKHSDERGDLIVFLKQAELPKNLQKFGQIYFVTFNKPGVVRGNHYHKHWHEWFGIVAGKVKVVLFDIETNKRHEFELDASNDKYKRLEIGPNIVHAFKSISDYAALINYANSEWADSDSYHHTILS